MVKEEVVDRGKERGFADALLVEEAIHDGWISVVDVRMPDEFLELCQHAGVDIGEAAVLRHAREKRGIALLDDEAPRDLARSLRVPVRGTLGIMIDAVRKGLLERKEALIKLDEVSEIMYVSGEVYRRARTAIEKEQA
jgi:predicted nucleic acid-binding protein